MPTQPDHIHNLIKVISSKLQADPQIAEALRVLGYTPPTNIQADIIAIYVVLEFMAATTPHPEPDPLGFP